MGNGIHLDDYHLAIETQLLTHLPWLKFAKSYAEITNQFHVPAAFIGVTGWEPLDVQPGNGQLSVNLHCQILIAFSMELDTYQFDVRNAALATSLFIQDNNFGLPVSPAKVISAEPYALEPDLDGYAVWSVAFVQNANMGVTKLEKDETRIGIRFAANPVDEDNPDEYSPLEL